MNMFKNIAKFIGCVAAVGSSSMVLGSAVALGLAALAS